jgi:cytochrome c oxidase subunit 3
MNAQTRSRTNELQLLAVLATVVMLFAAFSSAYLIRRTGSDWQRVEFPTILWINTGILIVSSFTLEVARRRSGIWLALTVALGAAFLVGQAFAWRTMAAHGVFLPTNPHASFLYLLSAVHALHLIGGLAALVYALRRRAAIGLCAAYWHFVGGVWVYLILLLRVM